MSFPGLAWNVREWAARPRRRPSARRLIYPCQHTLQTSPRPRCIAASPIRSADYCATILRSGCITARRVLSPVFVPARWLCFPVPAQREVGSRAAPCHSRRRSRPPASNATLSCSVCKPSQRELQAVDRSVLTGEVAQCCQPVPEPARQAQVLCVDEKSQCQAMERTHPMFPDVSQRRHQAIIPGSAEGAEALSAVHAPAQMMPMDCRAIGVGGQRRFSAATPHHHRSGGLRDDRTHAESIRRAGQLRWFGNLQMSQVRRCMLGEGRRAGWVTICGEEIGQDLGILAGRE